MGEGKFEINQKCLDCVQISSLFFSRRQQQPAEGAWQWEGRGGRLRPVDGGWEWEWSWWLGVRSHTRGGISTFT